MSTREAHTRRHDILDAAEHLMLRQGYAATSMGAICAEVGVTKGALFHHFASKEDLARAALARWIDKTLAPLAFALDPRSNEDPLKRLQQMFDAMMEWGRAMTTPGCLAGLFAMEQGLVNEEIHTQVARSFDQFRNSLERELEAAWSYHHGGDAPPPDLNAGAFATLILSSLQGSLLLGRVFPEQPTTTDVFDELWPCIEQKVLRTE